MWNSFYKNLEQYQDKKVIFNYSLKGTLFIPLGFSAVKPGLNVEGFKSSMITFLNEPKNVDVDFREFIKFNVLDNNGNYLCTFQFKDGTESFESIDTPITFDS